MVLCLLYIKEKTDIMSIKSKHKTKSKLDFFNFCGYNAVNLRLLNNSPLFWKGEGICSILKKKF